jgi:hypothetical protein
MTCPKRTRSVRRVASRSKRAAAKIPLGDGSIVEYREAIRLESKLPAVWLELVSPLPSRRLGGLLVSKGDVMADRRNYNSQSRRRSDVHSTPAPANRPQWSNAQKAKAKTVGKGQNRWQNPASARGVQRRTLTGHLARVHCVAFSPDGKLAVSGAGGFAQRDGRRLFVDWTSASARTGCIA